MRRNSAKVSERNNNTATMSGQENPDKFSAKSINNFRNNILNWYDKNRRVLPWRALPGRVMDPYYVWLSEIMLQQTVVAAVIPYFLKFVKRWPTVYDLARADDADVMDAWAGLGYYARARNLHKCAKVVSEKLKGKFPRTENELQELPGIGPYTSAAISAIAYDLPATVVDGNVERVVARYLNLREPLPGVKPKLREYAAILSDGRVDRPGDFAQAMMDLGATVCTPRSPSCGVCPVAKSCKGRAAGDPESLPARSAKKQKPRKCGHVYWVVNKSGQVLLEKRPEKGLLGRMVGFPTSEWVLHGQQNPGHPAFLKTSPVRELKDHVVLHSFTHFDLELKGYIIETTAGKIKLPDNFFWADRKEVAVIGLPTLFKKFRSLVMS